MGWLYFSYHTNYVLVALLIAVIFLYLFDGGNNIPH